MESQSVISKLLTFNDVTILYVRILRIIGILPFEGRNIGFLGSNILAIFFSLSTLTNVSWLITYIINHLIKGSWEIDAISEAVCVIGLAIKYCTLLLVRTEFHNLLLDCKAIWDQCSEDEHRTISSFEKRSRSLFHVLLSSVSFVSIMYALTALTVKLPSTHGNGTYRRVLPYCWFVDGIDDSSSSYWLIFFLQVLVVFNTCVVILSVDTAAAFVAMINCGYLRVLKNRLFHITEVNGISSKHQVTSYENIVKCSKFHQSILIICGRLETLARAIFLSQLLSTGYNLSLAAYKLAGSDPHKYKFISMFAMYFMQLYICQWAPDCLLNESEGTSPAVYFASVELLNRRSSKILLIMLARAQRPVQLTAGGMIKLSLESFGSMITSAVSFFTVLRNFSK